MFEKILIANRGEIACRIIQTAKRMGIKTVAIFSPVDHTAQHVLLSDEAYPLEANASRESYLDQNKILNIARLASVNAIHPGYGFLSENAEFARHCQQQGFIFIGPPAEVIASMGSKARAKSILEPLQIPMIPGYHGQDQDIDFLKTIANKIGYPVLLKAANGGGGRGMRVVQSEMEFADALLATQREALASFGSPHMMIEKYLIEPRHIEIQVAADQHGQAVHLFERDCSIQRRQQKIIEESRAPHLPEKVAQALADTAIKIVKAVGYVNLGTMEFLVDKEMNFYFLEMNTRLQVEHPITEKITGLDLVEWQFKIACGEPLPLTQSQISAKGHAIEVRICAEDPLENFIPASGKIHYLQFPTTTQEVRVDKGFVSGDTISQYYDSMIAKLIVYGKTREEAIGLLQTALQNTILCGIATNISLLSKITAHEAYQRGYLQTDFIPQNHLTLLAKPALENWQLVFFALYQRAVLQNISGNTAIANNWQMNLPGVFQTSFIFQNVRHEIKIQHDAVRNLKIKIDDKNAQAYSIQAEISGTHFQGVIVQQDHILNGYFYGQQISVSEFDPFSVANNANQAEQDLLAPMTGTIVNLCVQLGDEVAANSALLVLEAMKMEHTIKAPKAGKISKILFKTGELVSQGSKLIELEDIQQPT